MLARVARGERSKEIAARLGLTEDDLDFYGKYKAKVALELTTRPAKGKLVVVTAMTPTPLGEGKTVNSIGLALGLLWLISCSQQSWEAALAEGWGGE